MARKIKISKETRESLEKALIFLIGIGLGEATRRFALWFKENWWLNVLFVAFKVGIVGYAFWLGVEAWGELLEMEELGKKHHATGGRYGPYAMAPLLYWMVGAVMAVIMF